MNTDILDNWYDIHSNLRAAIASTDARKFRRMIYQAFWMCEEVLHECRGHADYLHPRWEKLIGAVTMIRLIMWTDHEAAQTLLINYRAEVNQ